MLHIASKYTRAETKREDKVLLQAKTYREIQPNKRNKVKKHTGKNQRKYNKRKKQEKHTIGMTTVERKPIAC
jgi:hypothetical protein